MTVVPVELVPAFRQLPECSAYFLSLTSERIFLADRYDLLDVQLDIESDHLEETFISLVHVGNANACRGVLGHEDAILSVKLRALFRACLVDGILVGMQNS